MVEACAFAVVPFGMTLYDVSHGAPMEADGIVPCASVFRKHVRAGVRISCRKKLHLLTLSYVGRWTCSAAGLPGLALTCLLKMEVDRLVLPGGSSSLEINPASALLIQQAELSCMLGRAAAETALSEGRWTCLLQLLLSSTRTCLLKIKVHRVISVCGSSSANVAVPWLSTNGLRNQV